MHWHCLSMHLQFRVLGLGLGLGLVVVMLLTYYGRLCLKCSGITAWM